MVNRIGLIIAVAGVFFAAGFAGLRGAEGQIRESPSVSIAQDRYDFGTIGEGIVLSHDFVFKNVGTAALSLKPIQDS